MASPWKQLIMQKPKHIFHFILYFIGVLLGITLATLSTWADYESTAYGFPRRAQTPFKGLSCPILMTRDETQTIKIRLTNSTEKKLSPSIRTEISTRVTADSKLEFFELAPGESLLVERIIGPQNIDLGQFIFVQASVFSSYPLPNRESTCGVFILPMQGNGTLILIAATILSLLFSAGGLFQLRQDGQPEKSIRPLLFIAIVMTLAMTLAFLGAWIPAALMIVLAVLTSFISFSIMIR
jgi:hypothetical protein